jgi:hypothetical protein
MWKYQEPGFIPGVPTVDMTDAEFERIEEEYERNNQVPASQKGCLKRSPLYKHVKDAPEAKEE